MKSKWIIPLVLAVCLVIGLVQQSRLARLKAETKELGSPPKRSVVDRHESHERSMTVPVSKESGGAASAHMALIISRYEQSSLLAQKWRNPATRTPEIIAELKRSSRAEQAEMWPHFATLGHKQVLDLIQRLQNNPNIADIDKSGVAQVCVERLSETNPAEALALILALFDLPERERYLIQTFNRCVVENPAAATQWFKEEYHKGNPVTRTPELLEAVVLAQARVDPARAVSRISSGDAAANPDSVAMLGSRLSSALRDAGEHHAFLAAMRQEEVESGGSPVLAKVRTQYVANLCREMMGWPFEDASALIGAEFAPVDIVTASHLITPGGLADVDHWADWFSKVDAPLDDKHPLSNFMSSWVQSDPSAAGKWLDQFPPGELRNMAIFQLVEFGMGSDPVHAANLAAMLPKGDRRTRLLDRALALWLSKDPESAATFAKEHGLAK